MGYPLQSAMAVMIVAKVHRTQSSLPAKCIIQEIKDVLDLQIINLRLVHRECHRAWWW
jgi:hypothetical protein